MLICTCFKTKKMRYKSLFLIALTAVSCGSGTGGNTSTDVNDTSVDTILIDTDTENASRVLATIPSSHEIIAVLVDHPDSRYDASLLNSQKSYLKYNTTMSKSLNLGAYGVDMSYASLFNQNQTVLQYMAVVKTMAEQLGIMQFFDEATMQKMEKNLDNKELMIEIISDAFYKSDQYLLENGQREIAAMIISGAWIEAMHTAFHLTKGQYAYNKKLSSRILMQCEAVDVMLEFLTEYQDGGITEITKEFQEIYMLVKQSSFSIRDDLYYCDDVAFKNIFDKISQIRSRYVSL